MGNTKLKKEIGLFTATALVVGNMMGSGIFMLPASVAKVSGPGGAIIAWVLTGLGSLVLAMTFANLGSKIPKTGGIYEYSRLAYGDFMGFISAWLYWNGSWIGNATIFIVLITYLGEIIPALTTIPIVGFIFATVILWGTTYINIRGTKFAGFMASAITVFKVILFIFFILVGLMSFDMKNLQPFFPDDKGISTIPAAAAITFWAFIGLETATVAGGEIKNPEKNISRSTILGILISIILYLIISIVAMGAMPQHRLAISTAPISEIIANRFKINSIGNILNLAISISVLGTAIGWILSTARVAFAAGEDNIFPTIFAKVHPKYNTPYVALIIGSVLINITFLLNFVKGLSDAYNFIVLLATLSYLPIYAASTMAELLLIAKKQKKFTFRNSICLVLKVGIGFFFSLWTIVASGAETVMYGFILILLGIPVYSYIKIKNEKNYFK